MNAKKYFRKRKNFDKERWKQIHRERENLRHDLSIMERKTAFFARRPTEKQIIRFYKKNYRLYHLRLIKRKLIRALMKPHLFIWLDFVRWILIDILRAKQAPFFGIFCFVALPSEGKTISMTAHLETMRLKYPELLIATNYNYVNQDAAINHWSDIVKFSKFCDNHHRKHIIAIDEIHLTFDSSNWKEFPQVLQVILSQNRHLQLQFLCSAQRYDRIPTKVKSICNYIVICKNVGHFDRLFFSYYFRQADYEDKFSGRRAKAHFLKAYVASDDLYACYNTMEMCDRMVADEVTEKTERQKAFDLLFHTAETSEYDAVLQAEE